MQRLWRKRHRKWTDYTDFKLLKHMQLKSIIKYELIDYANYISWLLPFFGQTYLKWTSYMGQWGMNLYKVWNADMLRRWFWIIPLLLRIKHLLREIDLKDRYHMILVECQEIKLFWCSGQWNWRNTGKS
jgi:hypothetical protein